MSAKQELKVLIASKLPVMIYGDPGLGKTSIIQQIAEEKNWILETLIASIREPSDFSGIPYVNNGVLNISIPEWALSFKEGKEGILFFDEITTCPYQIQASLLRIILDGVVGSHVLPKTVHMIAAGNMTNVSGTNALTHPLANRFIHYSMVPNAIEWSKGILSGFLDTSEDYEISDSWIDKIPLYKSFISLFIKNHPQMLHMMPSEESAENAAWPSPRSWEMAATILAVSHKCPIELVRKFLVGTIGSGPSDAFLAWLPERDLINLEDILNDPENYRLPDRADLQEIVIGGIISYLKQNKKYSKAVIILFKRIFMTCSKSLVVSHAPALSTVLKKLGELRAEDFSYLVPIMKML